MRAKLGAEKDLTAFKTLTSVHDVPLYMADDFTEYYFDEVKQLIAGSKDQAKWNKILRAGEPFEGHTNVSYLAATQFFGDGTVSTSFRLKSMHHVLMTELLCGERIEDYDAIVEFGAGIGDTTWVIIEKGFKGNYHIIDFPEVYKFSKHYLAAHPQIVFDRPHCEFHPDHNFEWPKGKVLFLATWSLSETPLALREAIAVKVKESNCDQLILFQKEFYGFNNMDYFLSTWQGATQITKYKLKQLIFQFHDGGSWYFHGKP